MYGDYRMDEMLEDETTQLLSMMSAANMRLLTVAKESQVDNQAKWYDTPYQVRSLQPQQIAKWSSVTVRESLKLPERNPFIVANPQA
ncbi:hypothetical protein, partial [Pseudoalteromonas sp. CAL494-MNA-CIBAN-0108]|uniref:hypothetical protein n=1 Tax=Pseudoalteromonas sp. CAL494-MNA-CIBAN-0108 TaxID=3140438 RepID=UPI00331B3886